MPKLKYELLEEEVRKLREENEQLLEKIRMESNEKDQIVYSLETDMKRFRGVFDDTERLVYRLKKLR